MGRGKNKRKSKRKDVEKVEPEDLDRFVGSSEEEEPNVEEEEDESSADESHGEEEQEDDDEKDSNDDIQKEKAQAPMEAGSSDDESSDSEEEEAASGMANAMSRILGTTPKTAGSVVLSKTTTPLQRQAQLEKSLLKEQKEKRRANRERNLTALHKPLTVATTASVGGGSSSSSVAKELEQERVHRRVATRGVVALFNAIAQHQKSAETQVSTESKGMQNVKKLSKHDFLDKIKAAAAATPETSAAVAEEAKPESSAKPKWNALQDDYMLNSKLKDWDKESSDEEVDVLGGDNDDWSDEEKAADLPASKKQRVGAR